MRHLLLTAFSLVLLACNGVPSEPSVALVPEARAAAPSSAPVPATSSGTPSTRPPPIAIGSEPIPVGTRITTTHRSKLSLNILLGGTRSTQTHDLRFVHRSELLRAGPEDLAFRLSVLEQIVPSEAPRTPAHGPLEGKTYVLRCGRDGHVRVTPPAPSTGSPAVPLDPSDLETIKSSVGCAPWFRRWPGVPSTLAAGDRVPLAGSVLFLDVPVDGVRLDSNHTAVTFEALDDEGARFNVRTRLVGDERTRMVLDLRGTVHLDPRRGTLRSLHLAGPIRVDASVQEAHLPPSVHAEGQLRIDVETREESPIR